jgi:hypothetical protein
MMARKRKAEELLLNILRFFIQGEVPALIPYLLWAGKSHDALLEEVGQPTERERKFYAAGKYSMLADMLIAMTSILESKVSKKQSDSNVSKSVLFA